MTREELEYQIKLLRAQKNNIDGMLTSVAHQFPDVVQAKHADESMRLGRQIAELQVQIQALSA